MTEDQTVGAQEVLDQGPRGRKLCASGLLRIHRGLFGTGTALTAKKWRR